MRLKTMAAVFCMVAYVVLMPSAALGSEPKFPGKGYIDQWRRAGALAEQGEMLSKQQPDQDTGQSLAFGKLACNNGCMV